MQDVIKINIETNHGTMQAELYASKTPKTVENFVNYIKQEYFNNTIFHRVIPGFMIQGGGFDQNMQEKDKDQAPVENEADLGIDNQAGTLAMARTNDPHSATSQFFINVADNTFLNHQNKSPAGWGYCAFGKITDGLEIAQKISKTETTSHGFHDDVPVKAVIIERISLVDPQ